MNVEKKTPSWVYWVFGLVVIAVIGIGSMGAPPNVRPVTPTPAATQPTDKVASTPVLPAPSDPAPPANWTYRIQADPMGQGSTSYATTKSLNTVEFGFPYHGPQHGRLTIRSGQGKGQDIMLFIDRGQFLVSSFDGCSVLMRFDEERPIRVSAVGAADHSTTTLFLSGFQGLVTRIKKAKTLRIQAPVYKEGEPVFQFDVSGLDWPPKKS